MYMYLYNTYLDIFDFTHVRLAVANRWSADFHHLISTRHIDLPAQAANSPCTDILLPVGAIVYCSNDDFTTVIAH